MTMTDAICAENLGKRYRIDHAANRSAGYRTLRDRLVELAKAPARLMRRGNPDGRTAEFWALRNVSFRVQAGEVVGIIGRNGSGKSTLLKILSRITKPTAGQAMLNGRVGSLLEVGTGFHPELTGRENIFLNGSILGIRHREIGRRLDEIIAFAGVEPFIDMPVKRYSSGMYVRLAFAVAAHLESEILIVDEVLAVGDAEFQRKCLGKMHEIGRAGRTVFFVSHNLATLQGLCGRGILLADGGIAEDGAIDQAIARYLRDLEYRASQDLAERTDRHGAGQVILTSAGATDGAHGATLTAGRPARFEFQLSDARRRSDCLFKIYDQQGRPVAAFDSRDRSPDDVCDPSIGREHACEVDELILVPGRYRINVAVFRDGVLQDHVEGATFFDVENGPIRGRQPSGNEHATNVCLPHRWTLPST